jgi:hypothetical protein
VRVELREFERGHEIEPASLVLGVAGGKELHSAAFIRLVDQDALVTRVLDDLRRARKAAVQRPRDRSLEKPEPSRGQERDSPKVR